MSAVSPSLTQAQLKNAKKVKLENEKNPTPQDIRTVANFIDNLRDPYVAERLNSFRNISVIAKVLGPVRTCNDFIPYLHEFVDDDDAVLLVLVEELGELIHLIGSYENVGVIFETLETLAGSEDSTIREKVVETVKTITKTINVETSIRVLLPYFRHLALGEWFTTRQSACALFHVVYPIAPPEIRKELRGTFDTLANDESPMVRRAACQALEKIIEVIEPEYIDIFVTIFHHLARDEQDSIRLLAVSACPAIAAAARQIDSIVSVFSPIYSLCTDQSWRVRYVAASKFAQLCNAVGENQFKGNDFVDSFIKLMSDAEPEVRSAAASQVANVAKLLGGEKTIRVLLGPIKALANDSCEFTRAALACCVMRVSDVLTSAETVEHLIPIFYQILKDSSPDVRLSVMVDLSCVDILGETAIANNIFVAICQLAKEKNWRVRLAIIEQIPHITQHLSSQFYQQKIVDVSMTWMGDIVASIREASAINLVRLSSVFGSSWALKYVIPQVLHLSTRKSYQFRQLSLRILADLVPVLGEAFTIEHIRPIVDKLQTTETVINVRMNLIKAYHEIGMILTNIQDIVSIIEIIDFEICNTQDLEMRILGPSCISKLKERIQHLQKDAENLHQAPQVETTSSSNK